MKMTFKNDENSNVKYLLYARTLTHALFSLHHVVNWLAMVAILYELQDKVDPTLRALETYGAGFLTNWNLFFQSVFLALALSHDVMEWRNSQDSPLGHKIRYCRDVLFSGIVMPVTSFVSSFFWVTFAIDRELIFPAVYDTVMPVWFNYCVHGNILILVLLETMLQARRHPTDEKMEIACLIVYELTYGAVYHLIYFFGGRWLYGVHGTMNWWQLCFFQLLVCAAGYFYYKIQYPINRLFHKAEDTNANGITNEEFNGLKENVENSCRCNVKSLYMNCRKRLGFRF